MIPKMSKREQKKENIKRIIATNYIMYKCLKGAPYLRPFGCLSIQLEECKKLKLYIDKNLT
jgi:hypothetical protein